MKILMVLSLFMLSAHGQGIAPLKIQSLNYPKQAINLKCKASDCQKLVVKFSDGNEKLIDLKSIARTVENRNRYSSNYYGYEPYEATQNVLDEAKKLHREAYHEKALIRDVSVAGMSILDTVMAPFILGAKLIKSRPKFGDSFADRRAARILLNNLLANQGTVIIKERFYQEVNHYLHKIPNSLTYIERFLNIGYFVNCSLEVLPFSNDYTLIVNEEFQGTFPIGENTEELELKLEGLVQSGTCSLI